MKDKPAIDSFNDLWAAGKRTSKRSTNDQSSVDSFQSKHYFISLEIGCKVNDVSIEVGAGMLFYLMFGPALERKVIDFQENYLHCQELTLELIKLLSVNPSEVN